MSKIAGELNRLFQEYADECIDQKHSARRVWDELDDFLQTSQDVGLDVVDYKLMWLDKDRLEITFTPTDVDSSMTYATIMVLPYLSLRGLQVSTSSDTISDYDRAMKGI